MSDPVKAFRLRRLARERIDDEIWYLADRLRQWRESREAKVNYEELKAAGEDLESWIENWGLFDPEDPDWLAVRDRHRNAILTSLKTRREFGALGVAQWDLRSEKPSPD